LVVRTNPSVGQLVMELNGQTEGALYYIGHTQAQYEDVRSSMQSPVSRHGVHNHPVSGHSEGYDDNVDDNDGSLFRSTFNQSRWPGRRLGVDNTMGD